MPKDFNAKSGKPIASKSNRASTSSQSALGGRPGDHLGAHDFAAGQLADFIVAPKAMVKQYTQGGAKGRQFDRELADDKG